MTTLNKLPNGYIPILDKGYVGLVDSMGDDLSVVNSARVSYDKQSDKLNMSDKKLLSFLWKEGHTSPFRHATLSFEIYAPLMVARQHWKYAVASTFVDDQNGWNESSRRYVTENEEFYIPLPSEWRSAPENSKQGSGGIVDLEIGAMMYRHLIMMVEQGQKYYEEALQLGVAPEQARLLLPAYGMYVRYRWTVSLHGVMHFITQRLEHDAQVEIQEYAKAIKTLSMGIFPESLSLLETE